MPILLLWAAPASIAFISAGYYFIAVANLVDSAVVLAAPAALTPADSRRRFRVIQGGKFA
jgi:hypothetical protein